MKKRTVTLSLVFTLLLTTLLVLSGCGDKGPAGEKAEGQAELLSLLPDNAAGIFFVNFKKFAKMEIFDKMIKEAQEKEVHKPGQPFKDYQDFINKTGIDPKKDIYSLAVAIFGRMGTMTRGEPDVVAVLHLNYDKSAIMGLIKEKAPDFAEEIYKDVAIFAGKDKKGKDMAFSFISDKIMAAGSPDRLKQVIDISKGGQGIMNNAKMKPYLEKFDSGAIISFLMDFPEEAKNAPQSGMFKMDLSKAEVILGQMDYSGSAWKGEIALISHNEEGNRQMVSTLNAVKMMGGALGPEAEELISNLDISASADSVKIKVTISDELVEKLKTKIEAQKKGMTAPQSPYGSE